MQIKAFSPLVGVSMDTIRYYEKMGLVHPQRLDNGYRDYDYQCVAQIKMIVVLKHLGFSLQEIAQLTTLKMNEITPECNQKALSLFDKKIKQLSNLMDFYQRALETLQMAKDLMNDQQYEKNQREIEQSINALFNQLKDGE